MIRFEKLKRDHLDLVLKWRISEHVSKVMLTKVENNLDLQNAWYKKIICDPSKKYWIINFNDIPIGLINLDAIDLKNSRCKAGYYIGDLSYLTLGGLIPVYLYNYVFTLLKLNKIYGEVVSSNGRMLRLHDLHGFRRVGTLKKHVFKDGEFLDVVIVELINEDWFKLGKFENQTAIFP